MVIIITSHGMGDSTHTHGYDQWYTLYKDFNPVGPTHSILSICRTVCVKVVYTSWMNVCTVDYSLYNPDQILHCIILVLGKRLIWSLLVLARQFAWFGLFWKFVWFWLVLKQHRHFSINLYQITTIGPYASQSNTQAWITLWSGVIFTLNHNRCKYFSSWLFNPFL